MIHTEPWRSYCPAGDKSGAGEILSPSSGVLYSGSVCVFVPGSCFVTLRPNGTIHSVNNIFSFLLLGYNSSQLLGKVQLLEHSQLLTIRCLWELLSYNNFEPGCAEHHIPDTSILRASSCREWKQPPRITSTWHIQPHRYKDFRTYTFI